MKRYSLKFQYTFEKDAKRLGKRYQSMKSDIASLCEDILANPNLGTDLGGGKIVFCDCLRNGLYLYI